MNESAVRCKPTVTINMLINKVKKENRKKKKKRKGKTATVVPLLILRC